MLAADLDHVADQHLAEARRQLRSVVANLVGVREDDIIRLSRPDQLLERVRKAVGRVHRQGRMLEHDNRARGRLCRAPRAARRALRALTGIAELRRPLPPPPTTCGAHTAGLFHHHQYAHMTRASNFSFSTSCAAASFAGARRTAASASAFRAA